MTYTFHEPLSAVDASFLAVEDSHAHMHIGGVSIFQASPVLREGGGLDIDRLRAFVSFGLHRIPRFRQKLAYVPISGAPVWVDDARFNIVYHVRHTALPFPGDLQKLKDLAGRIMSQPLERERPLWELWFVEGLEGDRFALISKMHHALADGISGVDIMSALLRPEPTETIPPAPAWLPRPAPSGWDLLTSQARRTVIDTPLRLIGGESGEDSGPSPGAPSLPQAVRAPTDLRTRVTKAFGAMASAIQPLDPTPLNVDIGPYRRFDWTRADIATVKSIRERLGGKMNDVVLSVVSGAVRRFLHRRGVRVDGLDFRAMVPVSVRREGERGALGNRVTQLLTHLPIEDADPVQRLAHTTEITAQLKGSGLAEGGQTFTAIADMLGTPIVARVARMASHNSFGNMVVTNVPGSPIGVYLLGAPLLESYPLVPLAPAQALNVAVLSYNGVLHWGVNADWDAVPDIADFVALIDDEIEQLRHAAGEKSGEAKAERPEKSPRAAPRKRASSSRSRRSSARTGQ